MVDAVTAIAVLGLTGVLGWASHLIFERTRVPDVIWLIAFGFIIAALQLLPASGLLTLAPVLATVALVALAFEFGLRTNVKEIAACLPRASLLSVISVATSMCGGAVVGIVVLGLDWTAALLLGAIVSGVSAETVSGVLRKAKLKDDLKGCLKLESVLADAMAVVVAALLIASYAGSQTGSPIAALGWSFAAGIIAGCIAGLGWVAASSAMKGPYNYILTLGLVFIVYALTEWVGGLGVLAAMSYGLVIGNAKRLPHRLKAHVGDHGASPFLKKFYSEVTLFLRTFFFVLLGTLALGADLGGGLVAGLALLAALILLRLPAVELAMAKRKIEKGEGWLMKTMLPKDLSAVVLLQFAIQKGIPGAAAWLGPVFIVILGSVIYTTVTSFILTRPEGPPKERLFSYEKAAARFARTKG